MRLRLKAASTVHCCPAWRGARGGVVQGEAALASKEMSWGSGSALPFSASEASAFVSSCELKARYYRLYNTMDGEGLTSFDNHIKLKNVTKTCIVSPFGLRSLRSLREQLRTKSTVLSSLQHHRWRRPNFVWQSYHVKKMVKITEKTCLVAFQKVGF